MPNYYYTLIASLPALPPKFDVPRCPITWPRLEDRLEMLQPEDAEVLSRLLDFLSWDRQPLDRTDEEVAANYRYFMDIEHNALVRELIDDRITARTIVSALRHKKLGLDASCGVGPWSETIRRRWHQPHFGLQARFPWIVRLQQLLAARDAAEAERLTMTVAWKTWSRLANQYHFSFEAVLLYVARWAIVNRWCSRNSELGRQRFTHILDQILEDHVSIEN